MAREPRRFALLVAATLLIAGCGGTDQPSVTPPPSGEPAPDRTPVIIDTDVGLDDIGAVLVLLRDPDVDVRAITISGTGIAHCQGGRLVIGYLLDEMGRSDIPFGCGRTSGGPDARPFPEEWRAGPDAGFGFDITPQVVAGTPPVATDVIREAVDGSPSAPILVTLGPLTNIEDAFAADPTIADRIAGIHAMLGTIDAKGNVAVDGLTYDDPLEWNAFADPSSIAAVFEATDVPITLVPLDATEDVPVPADLAERLATDLTPAGADLMHELIVHNPYLVDPSQGNYLWDELAALTLTDPDLAAWDETLVTIGPRGELIRDEEAGRPIAFATAADRDAFEAAFLEALRRGGPRAHPFVVAGTLTAAWDGTSCTLATENPTPGYYELDYTGRSGTPSSVVVVGVAAPNTWADLEAFLATVDLETTPQPPSWLIQGGQAMDEAGSGQPVTGSVTLKPGTWGPVCTEGTWPDLILHPGAPFEVTG